MERCITYIKFGVDLKGEIPGVWAGMNEKGVGLLGADGNAISNFQDDEYAGGEKTWETYEKVLFLTDSTDEAYKLLIDEYERMKIGETGDIVIIADRQKAVVLEYTLHQWGIQFTTEDTYVLRTNFFNVLKHLRPPSEDNSLHASSARRYDRAL